MPRLTDRRPAPPPGSPFLPPAPRPQLPPAAREVQQRATAGLILVLLGLVAMLLGGSPQRFKYVAAVALVVALVGLVLAISAMRAAKRAWSRRPRGALAGVVIGVIAAMASGAMLIAFLAYPTQTMQYMDCMAAAHTTAAQSACWQQLQNSIKP